MVKLTLVAAFSVIVGVVAAQSGFQIYQPGPNWWWIANSQNTMSWDCKSSSSISQFTVFILNSNPQVLAGKLAFIAQQNNADCSKLIDKTQLSQQTPATGYRLQFADTINSSLIYAESGDFEIKALGSAYPSSSAVSSSTGTASGPNSTGTSSNSKNNGGTSVKTSMGLGLAAIGAVLGFMTA